MKTIKFKVGTKQPSGRMVWDFFILRHKNGRAIREQLFEKSYDTLWMQFTGLKDKNGKEIYEGDIVKDTIGVRKVKIGKFKFTDPDSYDHSFFGVFGIWSDKTRSPFCTDDDDLEVIGNIYENPELLRKKNER